MTPCVAGAAEIDRIDFLVPKTMTAIFGWILTTCRIADIADFVLHGIIDSSVTSVRHD